jgi:biotin operon repressor
MSEKLSNELELSPKELRNKYPKALKYLFMIDILMRHPNGISNEYLRKELNINNTSSLHSAFKRLRSKNCIYEVRSHKGIAFLLVNKNKPTEDDRKIIVDKIINYQIPKYTSISSNDDYLCKNNISYLLNDMLINNPDGITADEISKTLNSSMQSIYNAIYYLRKIGNDIYRKNDKYYLNSATKNTAMKNIAMKNTAIKNNDIYKPKLLQNDNINFSKIDNSTIDKIRKLPEQDRHDVYDMLKKSLYYQKSATALIEANETIIRLNDEVEKGIL